MKTKTHRFQLVLAASLAFITLPLAGAPIAGLEASYLFSGNANDSSGNGNNGTVVGATLTTDRFGTADSAYYFTSPSQKIVLPTGLFGGDAGTFSLWLQSETPITGITGSGSINTLLAYQPPVPNGPTVNGRYIDLYVGDGTSLLEGDIFGTGAGPGEDPRSAVSVGSLGVIDTSWHHLALTSDSSGHHLYFDGIERTPTLFYDGITPASNLWPLQDVLAQLGGDSSSDLIDKHYKLDDVNIFDRALTSREIGELFTESSVPETNTWGLTLFVAMSFGYALHSRAAHRARKVIANR